ncbi:MAG: phospholipid carrier-dependent glycosyltransferase [Actinobacteria bacterium]|nr:phospholipid carrier-dependent glycosyltransferase [Actinomycetota bacterium]
MWACTALFVGLLATSSVVTPLLQAPDEFAHVDLVLGVARDANYPTYDGRRYSRAYYRWAGPYFGYSARDPRLTARAAPPKRARLGIDAMGGAQPDPKGKFNQQPQHPPLYYEAMALALRVERFLMPGSDPPALTTEIAFLRLLNVLLLAPLPILAWACLVRLGVRRNVAITGAALVLALPQLTHVGSTVNNDNLVIILGGAAAVPLTGVARGDLRTSTVLRLAILLAAAVLTKGFAVMLVPWAVAAYVAGGWTVGSIRRSLRPIATLLGATAIFGGWWYGYNLAREGSLLPSLEARLLPASMAPRGFSPDPWWFTRRFAAFFVERFWGWFGLYSARLPVWVIALASVVLAGLVAVAAFVVHTPGGSRRGPGPRRVDVALALLPLVLLTLFVARHAWTLYARTSTTPFIQGRYLFTAVVPLVAVAAIGLDHLVGRRAAAVAVLMGVAMHLVAFTTMVHRFWGAPGEGWGKELSALSAWSPYPTPALSIGAVVVAGLVVASLALVWDDRPTELARMPREAADP